MGELDLTKLKPGDRVAYCVNRRLGPNRYPVVTVARLTQTQIVLDNGMRVRITDNRWVARDAYGRALIDPDDPRVAESAAMDAWETLRGKLWDFERMRPNNSTEAGAALDTIEEAVVQCRKAMAEAVRDAS